MNDQVKCPHCGKVFEMTRAIAHLVEKERYQVELERLKLRADAQKWREELLKKIEKENQSKNKESEEKIKRKIREEMEFQIKDKNEEMGELKKQNKILQEQLLELTKSIRQLRNENEQRRIEDEIKLQAKAEQIRNEEKKRADDMSRLRFLEYEKKLQDVSKVNEDLRRKLEQGSQQLQGDVLEIELKNILKREFPYDEIKDVPTGIKGADVVQTVKNNYGKICGTIVWELKRTKIWTEGWIAKLKEDKRQVKADVAVLISQSLPNGVKNFTERSGVFIGNFEMILAISMLLRNKLIDLALSKSSQTGKEEKKEILWNYLKGREFIQRLEAISDAYSQLQNDLEVEKRWFTKKWAKQEKNIRSVIDNILGMHGDLEHIVGNELPEMKGFDILPSGNNEKSDKLF